MAGPEEAPRCRLPGGGALRPLEVADAEELYRLVERNRAYLAEWHAFDELGLNRLETQSAEGNRRSSLLATERQR